MLTGPTFLVPASYLTLRTLLFDSRSPATWED